MKIIASLLYSFAFAKFYMKINPAQPFISNPVYIQNILKRASFLGYFPILARGLVYRGYIHKEHCECEMQHADRKKRFTGYNQASISEP